MEEKEIKLEGIKIIISLVFFMCSLLLVTGYLNFKEIFVIENLLLFIPPLTLFVSKLILDKFVKYKK